MGTTDKYSECIALLEANKNLILTGAPGTGKTYLAREIATAMGAEWEFVQFHPSYDYTDFVEGLRPTPPDGKGNIGFERKDGVFKKFCKRAINIEGKRHQASILEEHYVPSDIIKSNNNQSLFKIIYRSIVDDIKKGKITKTKWGNTKPYDLQIKDGRIFAENKSEEERGFEEEDIEEMYDYWLNQGIYNTSNWGRKDLWNVIKEIVRRPTSSDYVVYGWILQELLSRTKQLIDEDWKTKSIQEQSFSNLNVQSLQPIYTSSSTPSSTKKDELKFYVFIIDEINRGEISKIFGELFFSIDPGYRGESGRVKTQYQNMITDKNDPFYEGFYVPENVYIIGTMNDIDRSVESMDFAMRRRFAWKEIKANENTGMLDNFKELKDEIVSKMNRLNNAIWNEETNEGIEGLSAAYHIGGAYFKKLELYDYENNLPEAYRQLWENHLRGVLFEYLRGSFNAADNLKKLEEVYYSKGIYE